MGKATVEYPFTDICGKVNKTDSAYFCHRNGKTYIRRIKNPHKGPMSAKQSNVVQDFTETVKRVRAIMADKSSPTYQKYLAEWKTGTSKCATLYGYIFQQEYAS